MGWSHTTRINLDSHPVKDFVSCYHGPGKQLSCRLAYGSARTRIPFKQCAIIHTTEHATDNDRKKTGGKDTARRTGFGFAHFLNIGVTTLIAASQKLSWKQVSVLPAIWFEIITNQMKPMHVGVSQEYFEKAKCSVCCRHVHSNKALYDRPAWSQQKPGTWLILYFKHVACGENDLQLTFVAY